MGFLKIGSGGQAEPGGRFRCEVPRNIELFNDNVVGSVVRHESGKILTFANVSKIRRAQVGAMPTPGVGM
jgi:hypothetical protein